MSAATTAKGEMSRQAIVDAAVRRFGTDGFPIVERRRHRPRRRCQRNVGVRVPIALGGRVLDSPEKVIAYLDEINRRRVTPEPARALEALDRLGAVCVLVDGLGARAHGATRPTSDIDLVPGGDDDSVAR